MIINHNITAMNTYRQLTTNNSGTSKSLEKLSSGYRINRAGDDAAGLAISEKMRAQIKGLDMAVKNSQDGISLIQTAEGALAETHSILQRMRELAVQASNGTNDGVTASTAAGAADEKDLHKLQEELTQLQDEIDRIAEKTTFNNKYILKGNYADGKQEIKLQVGANENDTMSFNIGSMDAATLEVDSGSVAISNFGSAQSAITAIDDAIQTVSKERSKLGAVQNRLEHTINNLSTASENLSAAESRIRDVDMAKEMMTFTKFSILSQASTAMLAQANQVPQGVLQLLG